MLESYFFAGFLGAAFLVVVFLAAFLENAFGT